MCTALAALMEGKVTPSEQIDDAGKFMVWIPLTSRAAGSILTIRSTAIGT